MQEVAIVGVPDRVWGEVGLAAVVLRPGTEADEAELLAWMQDKVARYKLPKRVVFWEEMPKSGYGKITKSWCARRWRHRATWPSQRCSRPEGDGDASSRTRHPAPAADVDTSGAVQPGAHLQPAFG